MVTKLLRAEEAASIMDVSKSLVYRLIRTGELPAVRFGTAVRIKPEDLNAFIEANTEPSAKTVHMAPVKSNKVQ